MKYKFIKQLLTLKLALNQQFSFLDTITIIVVVLHLIDFSTGAIANGPCKKAKKGGIHESCGMKCEWNGDCKEIVENESCSCDGKAVFTSATTNFKVIISKLISIRK